MSKTRECVVCQHSNPPGTTTCQQCSAPLTLRETLYVPSDGGETQDLQAFQDMLPPAGAIALSLMGRQEPLIVKIRDRIMIGRYSAATDAGFLDLTPYHAGLMGVSREHAVIESGVDGYLLIDCDSKNGTWLNQQRLEPYLAYPLYSGDRIQLGQFVMMLYLPE